MHGSDRIPDLNTDYERAYGWKGKTIYESEMALWSRVHAEVLSKIA